MAYIGNPPISGNFQVCDAISVVNGQAAYTMQVSSANVSPESANHMLVSLNGVLQKPGSSFTISGSTITFASNLATGDVIDFILLLGNVNDIGTPSDSTVTNAKTNFTTTSSAAGLQIKGDGTTAGALQLNCEQNSHGIKLQSPAHSSSQSYTLKFPTGNVTADRFLKVASVSGSGTTGIGQLSFAEAGGGQKKLLSTTTVSSGVAEVDITANIDSTYARYEITCDNFSCVTHAASLRGRFFTSGSVESGNNYRWVYHYEQNDNSDTARNRENSNATYFQILDEVREVVAEPAHFRLTFYSPSDANAYTYADWLATYSRDGGNANFLRGVVQYQQAQAQDGIRFYMSSGNIDSGVFKLYGIT